MKLIHGKELTEFVDGMIYDKKQVKSHSIDLTVKAVYELEGQGSLDLGGSEYKEPKRNKIEPVKKYQDDKYGWWDLKPGTYLITLNETIALDKTMDAMGKIEGIGLISPHPRLLKSGAVHPTLMTMKWEPDYILPLTVGENGISLKENARISKILVFK
ncbi:MAG: hypothetical protein KAR20_17370 [Candidatus Heimdallarchaeota archaeon]|nr:hypothetical protein [Candidatus Heimdallarchaeota archaeon]